MAFDLRLAIGLLFLCCGVILLLHGVSVGALVLGINVNLWWGGVMLLFGSVMTYLGSRARSDH